MPTLGKLEMEQYCETLTQVLKAGFGRTKQISATVFEEFQSDRLPVRLVAIHLEKMDDEGRVRFEPIDSASLWDRLRRIDAELIDKNNSMRGIISSGRIVRVYDTVQQANRRIPTVYLVKPDQIRHWTRTMAMRDADAIAADIMAWTAKSPGSKTVAGRVQ